MATAVSYQGVVLSNVLTRDFDQTIVRDDSNTDKWFSRFRVTVEGLANASILTAAVVNLGITGAGVAGTVPGRVFRTAGTRLAEDRGEFIYYEDGIEVLKSNPSLDADNGPKVSNLKITHVSSATVKVQFTIECCLVDCQIDNPPFNVIGNRWSSADDYDDSFRCTRTWRGKLRMGSSKFSPHSFRPLVVPPLQYGWRRSRMHFIGEANSLELGYEVTDQQLMGDAPPWPAAKMQIAHSEGFAITGAKGFSNFSIHLEGLPGVDRKQMIGWGISIMIAKMFGQSGNVTRFFRQVVVTEHNGDSVSAVDISAQLEKLASADSVGLVTNPIRAIGAAGIERMGGSLRELGLSNYDAGLTINLGSSGNATLAGMFGAYLQTPCSSQHGMFSEGTTPVPQDGDYGRDNQQDTQVSYTDGPVPPAMDIPYSQDQQEAMYIHAVINSRYDVYDGRVFCPIAKGGGQGSGAFADGKETIAAVRIHPRTAKRIISLEMERLGKAPWLWKLADFTDSNGIKNFFQRCVPNFRPPQVLGDGSILHAVDADYYFVLDRAPNDGESYQAGSFPWDTSNANQNVYAAGNFIEASGEKGLG